MINVLLVDDHRLFRLGVSKMLPERKGFKVVGEANSAEEGVNLARKFRPHIVLMDIMMTGIGGLEATMRIGRIDSHIKTIALTACISSPFPVQALKAGAVGYLTKGVGPKELRTAIRKVYLGKRYLCAEVAQQIAELAFDSESASPFDLLSGREMQIMLMVINCRKVSEISADLHLSPKTVNSYRYRIFEKLGVSSDVELTLFAVRHGVAQMGPSVMTARNVG